MTQTAKHTPEQWLDVIESSIGGFMIQLSDGRWTSAKPADIKLMKAAPDMAEALQYVINSTLSSDKTWNELRDKCRAALAKAGVS